MSEQQKRYTGLALLGAGLLVLVRAASNVSDPAPSARYVAALGFGMVGCGAWWTVRRGD